jgi:hypothetical protein
VEHEVSNAFRVDGADRSVGHPFLQYFLQELDDPPLLARRSTWLRA